MQWTEEKILQLSPNDGTSRRGKTMARSSKWQQLATDYKTIWGLCIGSGKNPYQVQADLQTARFACSCPVRALPCKHILGMLLLYAKSSANFKYLPPPDWIKIAPAVVAATTTATIAPSKTATELEKAALAKEKRWQKRLQLMESGLAELQLWLEDIIRQGVANLPIQQSSFWDAVAAKMVDAKLPRVSSFLKETYQMTLTTEDWLEPVITRLGELQLWIDAFGNREKLPKALQEELYNALGRNLKKSDILQNNPSVKDNWLVLAVLEEVDVEGRNYRKVWLLGLKKQQFALLLDFSFGNVGYEQQYFTDTVIQSSLVYYSTLSPQRAICENYQLLEKTTLEVDECNSCDSFEQLLTIYAKALNQNPWVINQPTILKEIQPIYDTKKEQLYLVDNQNCIIPTVALAEEALWKLLAMSGGQPIQLFGEWNGHLFSPISVLDAIEGIVVL